MAIYNEILYAATEGGIVAWDITNDQATKYTPLDGLGHLGAYDIVACPVPELRIIAATETGLSLFDPSTKSWSTTPLTPQDSNVVSSKVDRLFCDEENGRLLIGYSGIGVLEIASGSFQRYMEEDGLSWNGIDAMTVIGKDIWAVGYKGASVINDQGIKIYNEASGLLDEEVEAVAKGRDGTVWLGSGSGLIHFKDGKFELFDNNNVNGFPSGRIRGLSFAPDGTLWVANSSNNLCQFDPASSKCAYTYEGETDHYFKDLTVDKSGNVYFATNGGGIWGYDGNQWRNLYIKEDQLSGNFVEDFAEDQNENLWVATDNGAQRFDPKNISTQWEIFKAGDGGPASNWFQGIYPGPSGTVWFAHDSKRASSFDGTTWVRYGNEKEITGSVNAIAFDENSIPYIGTSEGLLILDGVSNKLLTETNGLPSKIIRSLLFDGTTMWIGTTKGLVRYQGDDLQVVLDSNTSGLPDDNISVIARDSTGSLLLGTPEGLARYEGDQVITLLVPDVSPGLFSSRSISAIAVSQDGSLWVGTYVGLYHGDGQNWEHITTADGLPTNNINAVYIDKSGTVWVGGGFTNSGGGIARFIPGQTSTLNPPATAEPYADQTSPKTSAQAKFDENNGLPIYADAEKLYSTESNLNYWSNSDLATLRQFYLSEFPKIEWLLDIDENGNCRDEDRCMGWHGDYSDSANRTFFFLKGEKGYLTMNLIPEGNQVNVVILINEPAD